MNPIADLLGFGIGVVLVTVGVGSTLVAAGRLAADGRPLAAFGLFTGLYGLRLVTASDIVEQAVGPSAPGAHLEAIITYTINIPILVLVQHFAGRGWHGAIAWLRWMWVVYAVGATAFALVTGRPWAAAGPNRTLVLVTLLVGWPQVFLARGAVSGLPHRHVLFAGAGILTALVVLENVGLRRPWGIGLEPFGMVAFIAALGYVVLARAAAHERDLWRLRLEIDRA
jgi:hypothetical protein